MNAVSVRAPYRTEKRRRLPVAEKTHVQTEGRSDTSISILSVAGRFSGPLPGVKVDKEAETIFQ